MRYKSWLFMVCVMAMLANCDDNVGQNVPDADLVGTQWTLESMVRPGEPEIEPEPTKVYNIQFNADSVFGGQDDCNSYGGIYALTGDSGMRLDNIVATAKGCGPATIGGYITTLRIIDAYEIRGNTLRLQSEMGSALKYKNME